MEKYLITIAVCAACSEHTARLHVVGLLGAASPDEAVRLFRQEQQLPAICKDMRLEGVPLRLRPLEADGRLWTRRGNAWVYALGLIEQKVRSWLMECTPK